MSGLNNLKPDRVVKAFLRAGWTFERQTGSHVILSKGDNPLILTIPAHKGKPVKQGLLRSLLSITGLTEAEFLNLYK
jgi:predicted RNA binding protein YcfA (HicA-like mRNA interferase family)